MKQMIAYCGLDCEKCDAYIATINNDDELRKKTAKLWSTLNEVEITPEMINCVGCRVDGVKTYFCGNMCDIRKCAMEKKLETCGKCSKMNSCKMIKQVQDNNIDAYNNLK